MYRVKKILVHGMVTCLLITPVVGSAAEKAAPEETAQNQKAAAPEPGMKVGDLTMTLTLSGMSDYVSRGISNTNHKPAVQATGKITHDPTGLYLSLFGSNVNFKPAIPANDDPYMELDVSGGWSKEIQGVAIDAGALHYAYPGADKVLKLYFDELYLGLGYKLSELEMNGKYSYSPRFGGSLQGNSASYLDLSLAYPLPEDFKVSGHYGLSFGNYFKSTEANSVGHYSDYNIALSKDILGATAALTWNTADGRAKDWQGPLRFLARDQLVLGVSKNF